MTFDDRPPTMSGEPGTSVGMRTSELVWVLDKPLRRSEVLPYSTSHAASTGAQGSSAGRRPKLQCLRFNVKHREQLVRQVDITLWVVHFRRRRRLAGARRVHPAEGLQRTFHVKRERQMAGSGRDLTTRRCYVGIRTPLPHLLWCAGSRGARTSGAHVHRSGSWLTMCSTRSREDEPDSGTRLSHEHWFCGCFRTRRGNRSLFSPDKGSRLS